MNRFNILYRRLLLWVHTMNTEFKYRKYDSEICCCGSALHETPCGGGVNVCRSQKEYSVTTIIERKRKELSL